MNTTQMIAGVDAMLAREMQRILEEEAAKMWQCHFDKKRMVWVITCDGHEITTRDTKAEAITICKKENGEEAKEWHPESESSASG